MNLLPLVKLGFEFARLVRAFSRKRKRNDEDHYYPAAPMQVGLRPAQCFHCRQWLPKKPKRGCPGRPLETMELP